jgi:uncharacterized membrane protein
MTSKLAAAMPFLGATLAVAGIAGFIEASAHQPNSCLIRERGSPCHHGLSPTAYDLLRIASWALVISGALLVLIGLMRYWIEAHRA